MLLLRTLAGSKLHGLSSSTSDTDLFEVYSESSDFTSTGKIEVQTFKDNVDLTQMTLGPFMEHALMGSHQSLDAMFSQVAEVDRISALRAGFVADSSVLQRLIGTIHELVHQREPKKFRHALRIAYNAQELFETGRYNPTLSEEQVEKIKATMYEPYDVVLSEIKTVFPRMNFYYRELRGLPSDVVERIRGE